MDLGLVSRRRWGYKDRREPKTTDMHALTSAGAAILAELWDAAGIDLTLRWSRETPYWSPIFAHHALRINDALIALEAAGRLAGLPLVDWADDGMFKDFKKEDPETHQRIWHAAVEPDGWIYLSDGATSLAVLIEVDMNTENPGGQATNSWHAKMLRYADLFKSKEPFLAGKDQPLVLCFATTERRIDTLRDATKKAGGRTNYWFAPLLVLNDPTTLFTHPFAVCGTTETRTLAAKLRL